MDQEEPHSPKLTPLDVADKVEEFRALLDRAKVQDYARVVIGDAAYRKLVSIMDQWTNRVEPFQLTAPARETAGPTDPTLDADNNSQLLNAQNLTSLEGGNNRDNPQQR